MMVLLLSDALLEKCCTCLGFVLYGILQILQILFTINVSYFTKVYTLVRKFLIKNIIKPLKAKTTVYVLVVLF